MTSGILFDFNGVIVDDESQHCDALITTLAECGYALDRDTYYREYLGFDDRECFRFSFERMGRTPDEQALDQAIARKHAEYERSIRASMRLVPGVAEYIGPVDIAASGQSAGGISAMNFAIKLLE